MEWSRKIWKWLAAGVASLLVVAGVYLAGRRTSGGELDFAAAKRELELNTARGAALEKKLSEVHSKQVAVVADILSEEIALSQKQAQNEKLSPEDVIARLRVHGLITP